MTDNRHQHTVPKLHLRRFVAGGKTRIWQFDKVKDSWAKASVNSVAAHDRFYSDEILAPFEKGYAPSIARLIEGKNYYDLSKEDRDGVRLFVNHMERRTEQAREDILPLTRQLNKCLGTSVRPDPRRAQNGMILNVDRFGQMNVVVMENKTGVPFITSDNPMVDFLIEAYMPLTPTLSLALLHGRAFKKTAYVELNDDRHVEYQNLLQLCNARRFTYSKSKFKTSPEMLSTARNWRKNSRYDEYNFCNALCVKPKLPGIMPYKFDLLNLRNARHLESIQDGTWFERWSQDLILRQTLSAFLLECGFAAKTTTTPVYGWGKTGANAARGNSKMDQLAEHHASLWHLGTRFS